MDKHTFMLLYKLMACPRVEFANSVWCLYKIGDLKEIEKIQKIEKYHLIFLSVKELTPEATTVNCKIILFTVTYKNIFTLNAL